MRQNSSKPVRVLPADVYDLLELKALEMGGIGKGRDFDDNNCPVCAYGLVIDGARTEPTDEPLQTTLGSGPGSHDADYVSWCLAFAGIGRLASDSAVARVRIEQDLPYGSRVPFDAWCEELNVVRGDQ